ncbi:hypothetical protein ACHAWF_017390 [Thalassiosira exigua]
MMRGGRGDGVGGGGRGSGGGGGSRWRGGGGGGGRGGGGGTSRGGRTTGGGGGRGGSRIGGGGRPDAPPPPTFAAAGDSAPAPDTDPSLRVLCFAESGSRIALACYLEDENEILIEDGTSCGGEDTERIVRGVLAEARPNLILVPGKVAANAPLLECLTTRPWEEGEGASRRGGVGVAREEEGRDDDDARTATGGGGGGSESIPYQLLKSSAFEPRQCRSVLLRSLRVLSLMRRTASSSAGDGRSRENFSHAFDPRAGTTASSAYGTRQPSSFHSLASIVDFDSPALVRALGALASHLRNTAFRLEEGHTVTVSDVRRCPAPDARVRLDGPALRALRAFATDRHPLAGVGDVRGRTRQRGKDGFSLFALLDRTRSKAGRDRLRRWMARPLRNPDEIRARHAGLDLLLNPECRPASSLLSERMGEVGSVDAILLRMQRCAARPDDFLSLGRTLEAAVSIAAALAGEVRERAGRMDASERGSAEASEGRSGATADETFVRGPRAAYVDEILARCHVPAMRALRERMATVIDEEVTAEARDRVAIHYGFHEELDRAKETFETLDGGAASPGEASRPRFAQGGLPAAGRLPGVHRQAPARARRLDEDFEFVFVQDDDAFFKSDEMNQLDEEIGDLDAFIKDTEAFIVSDLEEEILEREGELRGTFGALADLDCALSLAGCAADLGFVRPEIAPAEEGVIHIENGRHPLQELIVDDFIPNDTRMDKENCVLVVTGPNFSGKSCYARQVGVLVYLAHVGSYLPCDSARISVVDQILANFGDVETCAVPQSTFQRDLTQMAGIMRKCTPNTPVLIDEFGKGTAPTSDIAVMTSAVPQLAQSGCKVVCTTHFLEMFSLGLLTDSSDGIKAVRMSIHVPESNEDDAVPLFKLEDGVASSSAGLVCARMAGLDEKVVDRASDIITALREGKQVKPLPESVNANSPFQPNVRSAIRLFLAVDSWANATDEDLDLLQELVDRM